MSTSGDLLKKMHREFAAFQNKRRQDPVLAFIKPPECRLNLCSCGHGKRQSAEYCDSCADERRYLKQKFHVAFWTGQQHDHSFAERPVKFCPTPTRIDPGSGGRARVEHGEQLLDTAARLYENELSRYG